MGKTVFNYMAKNVNLHKIMAAKVNLIFVEEDAFFETNR